MVSRGIRPAAVISSIVKKINCCASPVKWNHTRNFLTAKSLVKAISACFRCVIVIIITIIISKWLLQCMLLLNVTCSWSWHWSHVICCEQFHHDVVLLCVWHAFVRGCVVVGWLLLFISQNPGYMKENFIIIIESLHLADAGMQHNVSHGLCAVDSHSAGSFHKHLCAMICAIYTTIGTRLMPTGVFFF